MSVLTRKQNAALTELLLAIEHIKVPLLLSAKQAEVYNELMFAVIKVQSEFKLE